MDEPLVDKIAIVTGIGRSIALGYARAGARICRDRTHTD